jgi:mannosyl-3-phosphoglycerate phosphatase
MTLIFTDLDGTLLDESCSWDLARPAIEQLDRQGVPWILVSSKTRSEIEALREDLGHVHPFVVENGGAAYIPRGYFGAPAPGAAESGGYEVLRWGRPYPELVEALRRASAAAGCPVTGFSALTAEEVAQATGLPVAAARLAKQREYDEVFSVADESKLPALLAEIERAGLRWTHGGRFYHLCGDNDKATAVRALTGLFAARYGAVETIGLGDSLNDLPFLQIMDRPVLIRRRHPPAIRLRNRNTLYTRHAGPRGWNEAVTELLIAGEVTAGRHR